MTTSDFILGHSADDVEERKREARKVLWALLAALFIHCVVAYSIAISSGLFSSPMQVEEDKPVELTFVDLAPPPSAVPIAWKNCVDSDVPDSMTGASMRKDATIRTAAQSFVMNRLLRGVRSSHHERSVLPSGTEFSNSSATSAALEILEFLADSRSRWLAVTSGLCAGRSAMGYARAKTLGAVVGSRGCTRSGQVGHRQCISPPCDRRSPTGSAWS